MNLRRLLTVAAIGVGIGMVSAPVQAQGYSRSLRQGSSFTGTPTLSPYLDYFREPRGPLDAYHEYVRPRVELRETLQQQNRQLNAQARELRSLNTQWQRGRETGTLAPTGVGARFFNYSHFYPNMRR